jgi:hypothetical protein
MMGGDTRQKVCLAWALIAASMTGQLVAQNMAVAHWINDAGQSAPSRLTNGQVFVTNFKGTNDLTVTPVATDSAIHQPALIVTLTNGSAPAANSTWALTHFLGQTNNGTGDGVVGDLSLLLTGDAPTGSIQFDFAIPLTARDCVVFGDTDGNEYYQMHAYALKDSAYQELSLTGWTFKRYAGQMNAAPDSRWPQWNGSTAVLQNTSGLDLNWPVVTLKPDADVSRLVIVKFQGDDWRTGLQFMAPVCVPLSIAAVQTNALVRWPAVYSNLTLYVSDARMGAWTNTGLVPGLVNCFWTVTNRIGAAPVFYRLEGL